MEVKLKVVAFKLLEITDHSKEIKARERHHQTQFTSAVTHASYCSGNAGRRLFTQVTGALKKEGKR